MGEPVREAIENILARYIRKVGLGDSLLLEQDVINLKYDLMDYVYDYGIEKIEEIDKLRKEMRLKWKDKHLTNNPRISGKAQVDSLEQKTSI